MVSLVSGMQNKTVSVFETTIRILGGLLSAHLIASDYATVDSYFTFAFWHVILSSKCCLPGSNLVFIIFYHAIILWLLLTLKYSISKF